MIRPTRGLAVGWASKVVNAREYLNHRDEYAFGSVRDPDTGSFACEFTYVPLPIFDEAGQSFDLATLISSLKTGANFVLLGDYGAGKSSTLRELYLHIASDFRSSKSFAFPFLLNHILQP